MAEPLRVLIVEDSEDDTRLLVRRLRGGGYDVQWRRVETSDEMARALDAGPWDVILADFSLPRFSGEEALYLAQQRDLDIPFIVVSGAIGEETAVAMMKAGADDYLLKGHLARLAPAVARELEEAQTRRARREAEQALREREQFLQTVFDGIADGLGVRDRDLTLLRVNRWMEQRFADRMPLVGRKCYEVFQRRETVCPWCPCVRALNTGRTHSEVAPYPEARNPTGWLELTAFPMRSTDGEIIGVIEHVKDVTDRVEAEQKRRQYEAHLRTLTHELVHAEERERRRLAAGLHDSVGQALATAKMTLQALEHRAAGDGDLAETLARARGLVGEALEHTRGTVFDLSPPVLYELGFEAALDSLVERTQAVHGLNATLKTAGLSEPLGEEVRTILYRSIRELLHNVARHAHAENVTVTVRRDADTIRVTVEDDGVGFDPEQVRGRGDFAGGFGLFEVRERLDYLGGSAEVVSAPGQGAQVTLTAPLEPKD